MLMVVMLKAIYAECPYWVVHVECHYAECRYAACRYAECRYAECRYAECRGALKSKSSLEPIL
jgi:hypothetical protein